MFDLIKQWKERRYLERLKASGLSLGSEVYLNDGFFLDPSHCHLITIEDNVVFGPAVTVLAHDAGLKRAVGKTRVRPVRLKHNCFIGARSVILPGATVGVNSIIGAGSVVNGEVPDNEVWAGVPAKRLMSLEELRGRLDQGAGTTISDSDFATNKQLREIFVKQVKELGVGWIG